MNRLAGWLLIGLGLAGCANPVPAATLRWDATPTDGRPLVGSLAGTVQAWQDEDFQPKPGVTVAVAGGPRAVTGPDGRFLLNGLKSGPVTLSIDAPGYEAAVPACRMPAEAGLEGVPIALLPVAPDRSDLLIGGVLTDSRGVGVAKGTVHGVDSSSDGGAGGNRRLKTDTFGAFALRLSAVKAGGQGSFTGYGVTPDGFRVESRSIRTLPLPDRGVLAVALTADAVQAP